MDSTAHRQAEGTDSLHYRPIKHQLHLQLNFRATSHPLGFDGSNSPARTRHDAPPGQGECRATMPKSAHPPISRAPMTTQKYDFRQFQEELTKLERKVEKQQPAKPLGKKAAAAQRLAMAREEFLGLQKRHGLTVADVVAFFPEEEGIAYLQELIIAAQAKPRRTRKS
ncbi:hypothetical protein ACPPVV_05125 [Rhodanobacter sp. Col0626]|uniref:hypothetical protein n=1 Tax=Rhodanobacter sp. Col0626 TaxID=3415679 RepID=UPI003CF32CAE